MTRTIIIHIVPNGTIVQELRTVSVLPPKMKTIKCKVIPGDWAVSGNDISCVAEDVDAVKAKVENCGYAWQLADAEAA